MSSPQVQIDEIRAMNHEINGSLREGKGARLRGLRLGDFAGEAEPWSTFPLTALRAGLATGARGLLASLLSLAENRDHGCGGGL